MLILGALYTKKVSASDSKDETWKRWERENITEKLDSKNINK